MKKQGANPAGHPARSTASFRNFAILSFILGLIFASPIGQIIYVAAMISVIGVPIAVLIQAIPTIALVTVAGYLIWRLVPPFGRWRPVISIAAACGLLVVIPPVHNAEIKAQVKGLVSGNVGPPSGPEDLSFEADQTLALISIGDRPSLCEQICLQLLMSGQATRVLMVPLTGSDAALEPAMRAYGYGLERRADCPEPEVSGVGARTHAQNFRDKTPGTISGRFATMLEQGHCLATVQASLGEADLAFMVLPSSVFPVPPTVSPIAALTEASRAGVYAPSTQGEMVPVWQHTSVSYSLLGPVLFSTFKIASGMSGTSVTWWRDGYDTGEHGFSTMAELIRSVGISLPAEVR